VPPEESRALKQEHLGIDEATDVLSFPLDGRDELPDGLPRALGDVVVCPQVVGDEWRGRSCTAAAPARLRPTATRWRSGSRCSHDPARRSRGTRPTGAGRGLGAAHALALAAHGAQVVVHDAGVEADGSGGDPALADAVVAEIEAAGGTAVATYENLANRRGLCACGRGGGRVARPLDVVIQNAGLLVWEELEDADASWERLRRVNVDAPFHLTRAAFPLMKRNGYGRFVFTTSGRAMSVEDTRAGLAAYAVGKMAHFALMLVTAAEGEQHGIRANAIITGGRHSHASP
jgi:NAD(P)-dependent dehydrogenase (short-subunit alcohol dehydrogenase family)